LGDDGEGGDAEEEPDVEEEPEAVLAEEEQTDLLRFNRRGLPPVGVEQGVEERELVELGTLVTRLGFSDLHLPILVELNECDVFLMTCTAGSVGSSSTRCLSSTWHARGEGKAGRTSNGGKRNNRCEPAAIGPHDIVRFMDGNAGRWQ